jgi:hypothetical protein
MMMTEQSDPPAGDSSSEPLRPIVVNINKKKKKKYSRGLEDLQRTGIGITRVSSKVARSVFKGMQEFRKASDKSARKKRDGALRDIVLNMGKASSKSLRVVSSVPRDLTKALNRRGGRRVMRRQLRIMSRLNRNLGFR